MSTSIRHCPPTDSGCNVTVAVPATHSSPRWNVNQNRPFLSCCFSGGFCYRNKESTNTKEHRERKLEKDIKPGKESGVLMHTCSSKTGLRGGKTAVWGFPELQKETPVSKTNIFFLKKIRSLAKSPTIHAQSETRRWSWQRAAARSLRKPRLLAVPQSTEDPGVQVKRSSFGELSRKLYPWSKGSLQE